MTLSFSLLNPMYKNVETNSNHITWLHNVQSSIRVKVQYSFREFTFCKMQPIIRTFGDPSLEELRRSKGYFRIHDKHLRHFASFWKILMLATSLIQNKEHHGKANFVGGASLAEQYFREDVWQNSVHSGKIELSTNILG